MAEAVCWKFNLRTSLAVPTHPVCEADLQGTLGQHSTQYSEVGCFPVTDKCQTVSANTSTCQAPHHRSCCCCCWCCLAGSGPHVQAFRLMRHVFDAWAAHTATRLQGAAAMAAGEAAAAYHSSRLAVRAWRAWRQCLAPAVQQRYSSALASLCLLGWYQHMLQQRQDPHSRGRLRAVLQSRSGCGSEQQWWRQRTMRKVVHGWRGLVVRGDVHYR
jgi:hypothetical protein